MTFRISEDIIKERKKIMVIMVCFMPIMMVAFVLLFSSQGNGIKDMQLALKIIGGVSTFVILEMVVVSKMMFKRIRSIIINFDEKGFTRINGKKTERFEFDEMTNVKITKKEGQLQKMIIKGKCANKAFILGGYDNMSQMNTLIETSVMTIGQKEQKIDWSSPKVVIAVMGLTFLVMAILSLIDGDILDYTSPLFQVVFGLYFMIFKPISKSSGARFKLLENIMGVLLIIGGSAVLIIRLLGL